MGYRVIFLDGLDGRPFVECEVCKKLERNVIEPVAIFVKDEDFERIDKQLRNLPKDKVDEVVGKLVKETNKLLGQSEVRCIFHCEKENKVWIENIEEYKKYRQRQKEAIEKEQPFNEDSPAKWRESLVDKFWQRIRVYKFEVDEYSKTEFSKAIHLKQKEKFRNFLKYSKCAEEKSYDFRRIIFPKFQDTNKKKVDILAKNKKKLGEMDDIHYFVRQLDSDDFWYIDRLIYLKDMDFWFKGEFKEFSHELFFGGAKFVDEAFFWSTKFKSIISFRYSTFCGKADFWSTQFLGGANFWNARFLGKTDFQGAKMEGEILFCFSNKIKEINLSNLQCKSKTHIEFRNLKTERLIINNFTNYSKEFLFFDLELLPGEKSDEPNLEIKNSILNKMRFINCDFSRGEKIKIEDSSITSSEFSNVKWGNVTEKRICPELFENEPSKAQDIYRQLKLAHDNQKDFIHGGDFYALEMRAYDKYLDSLSWLEHFKDKIIFKISKFASNYAQDWWLVLKWIYTIVIAMTVLVYIDSSRITFGNNYLEILLFTIFLVVNLVIFSKKARWWFKFLFLICYFFFLNFLAYKSFDIRLFFDDFFIALGKSLYPLKTVLNNDNQKYIPLYKTFFGISWIALSYLIYQLIVSLRRKIRR